MSLARQHGLFIVEDAAHSDPFCGPSGGDATIYSFYATKSMTSGEGGMVTTRSDGLDRRIRRLSLHGIQRTPGYPTWKYEVIETGFKYNLSDIQAAVALAQLRRLPETRRALRAIAGHYCSRFRDVEEIELPPGLEDPAHSCHLLFDPPESGPASDRAGMSLWSGWTGASRPASTSFPSHCTARLRTSVPIRRVNARRRWLSIPG